MSTMVFTDQGFKIGVKYAFGDVKKSPLVKKVVPQEVIAVPVAAPVVAKVIVADNDNDGISDKQDNCNNTPANVAVDATGCPLFLEEAVDVDLNVVFENNSAEIKSDSMTDVQRLADFMTEYKNTSVVIEGHSSAAGSAKYNLTLSQKRADAVKDLLISKFNLETSRLSAKGFGETQLISKGDTAADHDVNRRVIAKIEATVKKMKIKG